MTNTSAAINRLADLVLAQQKARLADQYPNSPWMAESETVQVVPGRKYTKIDVGPAHNMSGRYMVDNVTGEIFGIKGYGVVHKGHRYGTLDTIEAWNWGGYTARRVA